MNFGFGFLQRSTRTTAAITLSLSQQQDGFGFYYGTALSSAGESWNVNVMPPKPYWRGDFVLEGYEPHATDWVLYIDGEEMVRARERRDLQHSLATALLPSPDPESERA